MGLLRKAIAYFFILIIFGGCAPSVIKLESFKDESPLAQYGKTSNRNFYFDETITSSFKEKWEAEINGGFANSSVVIYDSAVFVNDLSGRIYSFSIKNGKTLGQLKYKGAISSTPIIHNTTLIFVVSEINENSSTLYYYDFNSGREIASVEIKGRYLSEMLKLSDGIVLISETGQALKYDFFGKNIWRNSSKQYVHSSPASDGNFIVYGNDVGEITSLNSKDGSLIYRKKIGNTFSAGAVISNNMIFIGDDEGIFYSIDIKSGDVNWEIHTGSKIKMEAVTNGDEIIVANLKGYLFKLTRDGKQIWKREINGLLNITPALTKNFLVLPDANKKIYFVSCDDGEIVDSIILDGRVKLNPVIKNNLLFIGYENGNLTAYELAK